MIKKFLLIGALALLASFSAKARLGYTLDECIKLYGTDYKSYPSITKDEGSLYTWETKTFNITVEFAPGSSTVGCMQYDAKMNGEEDTYFLTGNPAKDYAEFFKFFSPAVIADLLQKNAPGSVWKKIKARAKDETNYRSPVAIATYVSHLYDDEVNRNSESDHPQLVIKTVEFEKWDAALAKQVEAEEKAKKSEPKKLASDQL